MSWLKSLFRLGSRAKLIGTDLTGNQYFELVGRGVRPRRSVKLKNIRKEEQYTPDSVPPEWDRWLRGLRGDPPTHEESLARAQQSEILQQRVIQVKERDEQLQAQEVEDGLTARVLPRTKATEHASAPSFKSQAETSEDPTSTGKTFQPASWKP